LPLNNFCHQLPHRRALYADTINGFRDAVRSEKIDLRLPSARDMDMGRFMVEGVDHETKAVRTVDNDHCYF
jgi:hypothetical protein